MGRNIDCLRCGHKMNHVDKQDGYLVTFPIYWPEPWKLIFIVVLVAEKSSFLYLMK